MLPEGWFENPLVVLPNGDVIILMPRFSQDGGVFVSGYTPVNKTEGLDYSDYEQLRSV